MGAPRDLLGVCIDAYRAISSYGATEIVLLSKRHSLKWTEYTYALMALVLRPPAQC
jgi:hypothetical protein